MGIIGGHQENKQALYFIGLLEERQETQMLYLDPHFIQQSTPPNLSTHHTAKVGLAKLSQSTESICTDMTFGFYLRDLQDFYEWRSELYRLREYFNSEQLIFNLQDMKLRDSTCQFNVDNQGGFAIIDTQPSPSRRD